VEEFLEHILRLFLEQQVSYSVKLLRQKWNPIGYEDRQTSTCPIPPFTVDLFGQPIGFFTPVRLKHSPG
jgi:hypothetical protein